MTVRLWTRVECLCGRVAAIPEGGFFPLCGGCGRRMVAPHVMERRATYAVESFHGHQREYSDEQIEATLREREWPVEPQDWPEHSVRFDDGSTTRVPPWEVEPA